jgi:hypothetical protein
VSSDTQETRVGDATRFVVLNRRIHLYTPSDEGDIPFIQVVVESHLWAEVAGTFGTSGTTDDSHLDQMRRWIEENDGFNIRPLEGPRIGFGFQQRFSRISA